MIKWFTRYEIAGGEIVGQFMATDEDAIPNAQPGRGMLEGQHEALQGWISNGAFVAYSPAQQAAKAARPSFMHRWDNAGMSWVDTRDLAALKAARWAAIKGEREALMNAPIQSGGLVFDADAKARENVMGAVIEMQATGTLARRWTLADNTRAEVSLADLVALGSAIAARTELLQNQSQDLREAIEAAGSAQAIAAVHWPT